MEVSDSEHFGLELDGPYSSLLPPNDTNNLAVAAARAFSDWDGRGKKAHIRLTKNIPVAAGLGGGSADAAAVLVALSKAWDRPDAPLAEIGLALGADVPVSIRSTPAFMAGIGEDLINFPHLPCAGLVLVNPGVGVETRAVFKAYDDAPQRAGSFSESMASQFVPSHFGDGPATVGELAGLIDGCGNDLTSAACTFAPTIGDGLLALSESSECLVARMAGSGATCFGLYENGAKAQKAAREIELSSANAGWWVWSGELSDSRRNAEV